MKFGTDPDTAEVVRQRSAQRSAHKMRFGLLWLPAVAALSIAPQYADVHGGAALELVKRVEGGASLKRPGTAQCVDARGAVRLLAAEPAAVVGAETKNGGGAPTHALDARREATPLRWCPIARLH